MSDAGPYPEEADRVFPPVSRYSPPAPGAGPAGTPERSPRAGRFPAAGEKTGPGEG